MYSPTLPLSDIQHVIYKQERTENAIKQTNISKTRIQNNAKEKAGIIFNQMNTMNVCFITLLNEEQI